MGQHDMVLRGTRRLRGRRIRETRCSHNDSKEAPAASKMRGLGERRKWGSSIEEKGAERKEESTSNSQARPWLRCALLL